LYRYAEAIVLLGGHDKETAELAYDYGGGLYNFANPVYP
jgi:hypothetical protein